MRRVRIGIFGESPCGQCWAACCKQNGHAYAALLQGEEEVRRFRPWAVTGRFRDASGGEATEWVIPYVDGRCPFLGDDDRCNIYDARPAGCRQFQCTTHFNPAGGHGVFLDRNPDVRRLLEGY